MKFSKDKKVFSKTEDLPHLMQTNGFQQKNTCEIWNKVEVAGHASRWIAQPSLEDFSHHHSSFAAQMVSNSKLVILTPQAMRQNEDTGEAFGRYSPFSYRP